MTSPRLKKLQAILIKKEIDALLVSHQANISYLTGLQTQESFLFCNQSRVILITDSRYSREYQNFLKNKQVEILESSKPLQKILKTLSRETKSKKIGFEERHLSFFMYKKLRSYISSKLIPCLNIIEEMRMIKEAEEIELMKRAINITLETFKYIKDILKPGIKEIELAAEIERYLRLKGIAKTAFDIIVASGPNSSFPHAKITERRILPREPLLIDMGVDYQGYKSDLTRVFFLGKMDTQFKKAFSTVLSAQKKAQDLIKPGKTIDDIDRAVRSFIENKGFIGCFKHSLGHGIGLEIHELPKIGPKNKKRIHSGMVFTLEPAVYLDNKFGIRIEEVVLATDKGVEVLSGIRN